MGLLRGLGLVALCVIGLCAGPALAQTRAQPSAPLANPAIVVRKDFGSGPASLGAALVIEKMDVAVDISGGTASGSVAATFSNAGGAPVEADYTLDLPAGAIITGYALNVGEAMVDGVLVDRRTGMQAYENTVRRGVDPGVAEVTRTGDFNTRVFPVGRGAPRTVKLTFVAPLAADGSFRLPLSQDSAVGEFSVEVRISGQRSAPQLRAPGKLDLSLSGEGVARATARNFTPAGALDISGLAPLPAVVTEHRGERFFDIAVPLAGRDANAPSSPLTVFWDASLSRKDDDLAAERALLAAYVARVRPPQIQLLVFADRPVTRQAFSGETAAADLDRALGEMTYRGATSLAAIYATARIRPLSGDCLMFTDGDVTLDDYAPASLGCALSIISTAPDARRDTLAVLAGKSGGEAFDLSSLDARVILDRITTGGERVLAVTSQSGAPAAFTAFAYGDGVRLVGQAPDAGPLRVQTTGGTRTVTLDEARRRIHAGAGAIWARAKLAELSPATGAPDAASLAFARRYGVAGTGLVFLVLETADDYATNGVEPPLSLGRKMIDDYRVILARKSDTRKREEDARLAKMIQMWEAQKAWWTNPPKVTFNDRVEEVVAVGSRASAQAGVRPPPPPPPPPAPAAIMARPAPSIVADDIGSFPDRNVNEAMSRVAGVPLGRNDFGEGEGVSIRGNGPNPVEAENERKRRERLGQPTPTITTELAPWNPDRPYLKALSAASPARFDAVLREQETQYGALPAFYFDIAEHLFQQGRKAEARALVVNALELPSADILTLAILAERLMRYGDADRAIWVYERILALEPDRPQPRRSLALALIQRAEQAGTSPADQTRDLTRALALLTEVVMTPWSAAYDGVEIVALMEANRIVPRLNALGVAALPLDKRLIALLPVDLRVVMEWNTDKTDMDLWVYEPNGERVYYGHQASSAGARLSNDMTAGYGPEEYLLRNARPGRYEIRANAFASDRFNPNGASTVRALLYRNWGRADESVQVLEVELSKKNDNSANRDKDTVLIGRFTVEAPR